MEKNSANNISKNNQQFVRGWSWGDLKVSGKKIEFECSHLPWFSIPYSGIANTLLPSKNEIGLEFNVEDEGEAK
jgi:structure-specific recognition protein 1